MEPFSSLGIGLGTNFISEELSKKLSAFRDKKAVQTFLSTMRELEFNFEKQNDGTVATSDTFFFYIQNYKVIESIICYVLDSNVNQLSERAFLDDIQNKMVKRIEEVSSTKLSFNDTRVIQLFLESILSTTKDFLFNKISLDDRGFFYLLSQNNAEIAEVKKILLEKFKFTEKSIDDLQKQIALIAEPSNTIEGIRALLKSWNNRQIQNLGNRYIPELNISLELSKVLHGAAIDQSFTDDFLHKVDNFLIRMRESRLHQVEETCTNIAKIIVDMDFFQISHKEIDGLINALASLEALLRTKIDDLSQKENTSDEKKISDSNIDELYRALVRTNELQEYLGSDNVRAAVCPYILLVGDGGTGKSHLIADFIEQQNTDGKTEVLLLGQQFTTNTDVISVLPSLLGVTCTYHELFQFFESIACEQQSRLLICVDALNEGAGVTFWNGILSGWLELLKEYPHIGLLVSVRTQYEAELLKGHEDLRAGLIRMEHTGFASVAYDAMQRYFSFYNITTDSISILNTEFRNPLFLRLFCEGNRNRHCCLNDISLPMVYSHYIDEMEQRVAVRCCYHPAYKLVAKIIERMVSKRLSDSDGAVVLSLESVLQIVTNCSKQWNICTDVYGALLSEGVLTQGLDYKGREYVYVTYERIEDYFLSRKIAEAYSRMPLASFNLTYSWVIKRHDLLQFFDIVLAEDYGVELSDVFPDEKGMQANDMRNAFLYGLLWRKGNSITEHTIGYINSDILRYKGSFVLFIDALFSLSTRYEHCLNADHSFHFFEQDRLPDRDAKFIEVFDELYTNSDSAIYRLVDWGLCYSRQQHIDDGIAERSATILCWLLISPNNELRDKATKAIICILGSHIDSLLAVLKRFEKIDDPYILERLYAIAFGCVVIECNKEQVRKLAQYVYNTIFDCKKVYPNILLRTYAKNIIDYALRFDCLQGTDILVKKITPPYSSDFPKIPTDKEIKEYELDYKSDGFKDYYWSQLSILNSMKVEYSRDGQPGGYGDFGRYTFQSYFDDWLQLNPMDLKNAAIKQIFKLGYDVEKHGYYDRHCTHNVDIGTQRSKIERIGKKYQWIALYELAAKVSDNFKMKMYEDDSQKPAEAYCSGSFEPNIRNIDPTILNVNIPVNAQHASVEYIVPDVSYEEWLKDFSQVPSFEQCVTIEYKKRQYILLEGEYNWEEPKKLGSCVYELPRKNIWHQIRGYVVKTELFDELVKSLDGVDFMGRWMPEAHSNSAIFNKEYYWSDAYEFFKKQYYGEDAWSLINSHHLKSDFLGKVLIPVKCFYSERNGDLNVAGEYNSLSWYKPCGEIFQKLKLQYRGDSNSLLFDSEGNLICFDSSELLGQDIGFFIAKDKFIEFLEDSNYSLIWTSLQEKRVLKPMDGHQFDLPPKAIHLSAVYAMKQGKIFKSSETLFEDKLYSY
jgi:hypothetical protein